MNGSRSNRSLDDSDLERREPVWKALSTLWLAREPTPRDLAWIAGVLNDSGFAVAALRDIYLYEVAPVVYRNLGCLLYTSPSPRDGLLSRMPSSA